MLYTNYQNVSIFNQLKNQSFYKVTFWKVSGHLVVIIVNVIISLIIQVIGLFCACKINYSLNATYAFFAAFNLLFWIYNTILWPVNFVFTLIYFCIIIVAIYFTLDQRKICYCLAKQQLNFINFFLKMDVLLCK